MVDKFFFVLFFCLPVFIVIFSLRLMEMRPSTAWISLQAAVSNDEGHAFIQVQCHPDAAMKQQ